MLQDLLCEQIFSLKNIHSLQATNLAKMEDLIVKLGLQKTELNQLIKKLESEKNSVSIVSFKPNFIEKTDSDNITDCKVLKATAFDVNFCGIDSKEKPEQKCIFGYLISKTLSLLRPKV